MINFTKDRYYYADVYFNSKKDFIIQTRSGMLIDHLYSPCFLPFDANNEIIGEAVIKALSNSRMFDYDSDEYYDYMDLTKSKQRYDQWVGNLCAYFGVKTKKALFDNMKRSGVSLFNNQISISVTRHVRLDAWDGMGVEDIILSTESSFEEIGSGVKLALNYCI